MQDAGDIIFSGHALGSWEFLLHHFLVSCIFATQSGSLGMSFTKKGALGNNSKYSSIKFSIILFYK